MHQEHNIPWNLLAKNVKFVRDNPAYTPRHTGFFAKSPNASELNHFARSLASTIRTFSKTERAKYPTPWPYVFPTSGPIIYSDAVKAKHPEFLDDECQKIETWIQRVNHDPTLSPPRLRYTLGTGGLSDVAKVLFAEAVDPSDRDCRRSMETLLMLANHPEIPLDTLQTFGHELYSGWSRVADAPLTTYLLFNLIVAMGVQSKGGGGIEGKGDTLLERGDYTAMRFYEYTYRYYATSHNLKAQQIPHRKFWDTARAAAQGIEGEHAEGRRADLEEDRPPPVHLNMANLQEHLKIDFALLYMYDMVMEECGLDPDWESAMTQLLHGMVRGFKVNLDSGRWLEAEGKWSATFFI